MLSTKARLVVLAILISAVGREVPFLVGRKFEILLAAVNLTLKVIGTHGGPHSLFESPVFVIS